MIHMLSRFDLKPDGDIRSFRANYHTFVKQMRSRGLIESTGGIGMRVSDTPMDTNEDEKTKYYVVMSFRDRQQMDSAYDFIASTPSSPDTTHPDVHTAVLNSVFTCWQDVE